VGQKWYFLVRALFGSRPVGAAAFVFSKLKEGKNPRRLVDPKASPVGYSLLSDGFIEQTQKRLEDQIGRLTERSNVSEHRPSCG
jgi:hypothetical protein